MTYHLCSRMQHEERMARNSAFRAKNRQLAETLERVAVEYAANLGLVTEKTKTLGNIPEVLILSNQRIDRLYKMIEVDLTEESIISAAKQLIYEIADRIAGIRGALDKRNIAFNGVLIHYYHPRYDGLGLVHLAAPESESDQDGIAMVRMIYYPETLT